ncbi:hypothetical protein GCM10010336_24070 [Streptomyces goshikiensis]|nr:hypothetical protein GCM10010336_24070 [Streptomyces goshikiensis]
MGPRAEAAVDPTSTTAATRAVTAGSLGILIMGLLFAAAVWGVAGEGEGPTRTLKCQGHVNHWLNGTGPAPASPSATAGAPRTRQLCYRYNPVVAMCSAALSGEGKTWQLELSGQLRTTTLVQAVQVHRAWVLRLLG